MRPLLVLLALLVSGCSSPGQGLAFVVNRTGQAAGQGKSYAFPVAELRQSQGVLTLSAGPDVQLKIAREGDPAAMLGQNLALSGGRLLLEGRESTVHSGQLSLQTLQNGTFRGNFNAALGEGLEAVGYFEARLTPP